MYEVFPNLDIDLRETEKELVFLSDSHDEAAIRYLSGFVENVVVHDFDGKVDVVYVNDKFESDNLLNTYTKKRNLNGIDNLKRLIILLFISDMDSYHRIEENVIDVLQEDWISFWIVDIASNPMDIDRANVWSVGKCSVPYLPVALLVYFISKAIDQIEGASCVIEKLFYYNVNHIKRLLPAFVEVSRESNPDMSRTERAAQITEMISLISGEVDNEDFGYFGLRDMPEIVPEETGFSLFGVKSKKPPIGYKSKYGYSLNGLLDVLIDFVEEAVSKKWTNSSVLDTLKHAKYWILNEDGFNIELERAKKKNDDKKDELYEKLKKGQINDEFLKMYQEYYKRSILLDRCLEEKDKILKLGYERRGKIRELEHQLESFIPSMRYLKNNIGLDEDKLHDYVDNHFEELCNMHLCIDNNVESYTSDVKSDYCHVLPGMERDTIISVVWTNR
ncbi:MAG: hypothetical protein IJ619_12280 [Eubacterium sp.]|nr:hypothetical protein [Eubacterium sp.]